MTRNTGRYLNANESVDGICELCGVRPKSMGWMVYFFVAGMWECSQPELVGKKMEGLHSLKLT